MVVRTRMVRQRIDSVGSGHIARLLRRLQRSTSISRAPCMTNVSCHLAISPTVGVDAATARLVPPTPEMELERRL